MKEKRYKVRLETLQPVRVGAPKDPRSGIENPVAMVGDRLVVPGPTLKGALRAEIERFLIEAYYDTRARRWLPDKLDYQPCIPAPARSLSKDEQGLVSSGKYRDGGACHYPCKHQGDVRHTICPVCYLLGAPSLPGFVRVPFLYSSIRAEELYSARIDRALRTVAEESNRPYQLVRDGAVFDGTLLVVVEDSLTGWRVGQKRNLGDNSLGDKWLESEKLAPEELMKKYVLDRLEAITTLGGYKSKGFGMVKITVSEEKS